MPKPISLRDFRRFFEKYGATFGPARGGGSHWMLTRKHEGIIHKYPVPLISGRSVLDIYIPKARKKLKLTEADGVPDSEFFS